MWWRHGIPLVFQQVKQNKKDCNPNIYSSQQPALLYPPTPQSQVISVDTLDFEWFFLVIRFHSDMRSYYNLTIMGNVWSDQYYYSGKIKRWVQTWCFCLCFKDKPSLTLFLWLNSIPHCVTYYYIEGKNMWPVTGETFHLRSWSQLFGWR